MARIRGRNTKPEIRLRRALHARGFRFRIARRDLPGSPDIVLPRWRAVIFFHGCFWHLHGCRLSVMPKGNAEFWRAKLERNAERDRANACRLREADWRVLTVWECSIRGRCASGIEAVANRCAEWLRCGGKLDEISGRTDLVK